MLIQYVHRPASPPPNTGEKPKTLEEKWGETLSKSAAPGVATYLQNERNTFERERMVRFEEKWIQYTNHYEGKYGDTFKPIKGQSDLFVRRTRERVSTFRSKLLQLTTPVTGTPWDIRPSKIPAMLVAGMTEVDIAKSKAAAVAAKAKISDYLDDMKFRKTWHDCTFDICLIGAGVLRGPFARGALLPKLARLRPDLFKGLDVSKTPVIAHVPIGDFYWDPFCGQDIKKASACYVKHELTAHGLRQLGKSMGFDELQVEALIAAYPNGNLEFTNWDRLKGRTQPLDQRFTVWERWGLVPDIHQKAWAERYPESMAEGFEPTTGYLETWMCGPFVLKMGVEPFYSEDHPFTMIPLEKLPDSPCGQGAAEMVLDIQVIENAIARALHNNLAASSIPVNTWDMTQIDPRADLEVYPGKTIQARPHEMNGQRKALTMEVQPNNSPQLIQAFEFFERQIPVATSLPTPSSMQDIGGSGVRTTGMQKDLYAMTDTFIKLIIAEIDENCWTPVINWLYEWAIVYEGKEDSPFLADLEVVTDGVRAQVRRELIAQGQGALADFLQKTGLGDYMDENDLVRQIAPAMFGLDETSLLLGPVAFGEKMMAKAQRAAMEKAAAAHAEGTVANGLRAQTAPADALLQIAKTADPKDPSSSVMWGPLVQGALERAGAMSPQIYLGLQIWSYMKAREMQGMIPPELEGQMGTLIQAAQPTQAADLDPKYRQPDPQAAAQVPGAAPAPGQPLSPDNVHHAMGAPSGPEASSAAPASSQI